MQRRQVEMLSTLKQIIELVVNVVMYIEVK